jgi:hypothetical protein
MSCDDSTDAQDEKNELIEQALLMNLILSLDTRLEGKGEAAPSSTPAAVRDDSRPAAPEG